MARSAGALSIGALKEAVVQAMDLAKRRASGKEPVLVSVHGQVLAVGLVAVSFEGGMFVLVIEGEPGLAKGLTIGRLREALADAMDNGGAWGRNLADGKMVLLRVHGQLFSLVHAGTEARKGGALVLTGETR